jgi:hypothetical protein
VSGWCVPYPYTSPKRPVRISSHVIIVLNRFWNTRVSDEMRSGQHPDTSARVILNAVVQMAKNPEEAEKLRLAEKRIQQLEMELSAAQQIIRQSRQPESKQ